MPAANWCRDSTTGPFFWSVGALTRLWTRMRIGAFIILKLVCRASSAERRCNVQPDALLWCDVHWLRRRTPTFRLLYKKSATSCSFSRRTGNHFQADTMVCSLASYCIEWVFCYMSSVTCAHCYANSFCGTIYWHKMSSRTNYSAALEDCINNFYHHVLLTLYSFTRQGDTQSVWDLFYRHNANRCFILVTRNYMQFECRFYSVVSNMMEKLIYVTYSAS